MTTLSLFPARIRFTNTDGTLTPEAYRALKILFGRVGGALGDNGVDMFADASGVESMDLTRMDAVMQPQTAEAQAMADVMQSAALDVLMPDVVQPVSGNTLDKLVVKAGTAAAPSITTEGDENTGLYFPAADKVAVTTGGVERFRFGDSGNVAMATGKKFFLDGVTEAGDTYLIESAANVVDLYVGGVLALSITATTPTGTGKAVFDTSPTLVTPNLGTPSALVGTNITGTGTGFSAGSLTTAGNTYSMTGASTASGANAATFSGLLPTGSAASTNTWHQLDITGTPYWIPIWAK